MSKPKPMSSPEPGRDDEWCAGCGISGAKLEQRGCAHPRCAEWNVTDVPPRTPPLLHMPRVAGRIGSDPVAAVLDERHKTHGDFTHHADITQRLKAEMRESANWDRLSPAKKEALEMIQHKIGRILAGDPDFPDHWLDTSGYATLGGKDCSTGRNSAD